MTTKSSNSLTSTGQCQTTEIPRKANGIFPHLACLALLVCCSIPTLHAQLTTADILGTVTDPTGAVIPNATVTLTNTETHLQRTITTNASGDYQFTLLPVGHYSVATTIKGFKSSSTNDLSVEAGDRARADVQLSLGSQGETVNVQAQTPLLQAENATVSSTVTAKAVQDLPLNGRNFVQLVDLVPGATEGAGNGLSSGGRPDDRRENAAGLSVNGQDDTLNNWVVDGVDDNERIIGTIGVKPNVEGIQEITVQTNNYAAEAGRTAGGVINIITRSGTNQFHGSAYEYFRNDILDGRNVLQTTGARPELRQNQYGGSIGGPIFKDRTFFFFDYEGFRQVSGVTDTGTVPTQAEYNAIHSLDGLTPQSLLSNSNGTLQAYNGQITATHGPVPINPIALNYLMLFPAPTNSSLTNNYIISPNKTQNANTYDARVDHKFSDRNLFFGRFSYNKVDTFTPPNFGTVGGVEISGGRYNFDGPATDAAQQYAFGFTHTFTPDLLVDLRAAFTRINNLSLPLNYGTNIDEKLGFPSTMTSFSPFANSLTPISFGPFGDIGDGAYVPLQDIDNTFQYAGTVSWTKGNHQVKVGAGLLRRQARNVQSASAVGSYGFNLSSDTQNTNGVQLATQNNQIASALLGAFNNQSRNFNLFPPDYRSWEPSFFAQDSWRVTPQLTLLLGGRYDVFTPFTEAHNHISNFDYLQALASSPSTVSQALKIANVNGVNSQVDIPTDYSNFAPRIGFAYSVTPKTVVRGGYGLSFFPNNYTSNADLKNAPFTSVFSPSCQSTLAVQIESYQNGGVLPAGQNPDCATQGAPGSFSQGIPLPSAPTAAQIADLSTIPGLGFVAEATHFKSSLIQQFNLQFEQQYGANVITIGYVGNIAQHLPESINNINQPKPFDPITNPGGSARPLSAVLPNVGGVSYIASEGISNYNGLQTSFQRRFSQGLAFDANYTWSKALSDITGFSQQGGNQGWSDADPTRIRQIEYGDSENDIRNRFALSLNYEVQYGKSFTGIKKAALSGWQTNLIAVAQSGKPFTVINSGSNIDNPEGLGFSNRATPQNSGGNDRPNQIADARISNRSNAHFFNTAAFAPQPLGTVGTAQRNSLYGPNFRHVDLSLFKTFAVTERVGVQFRAESFNITNTPNFYMPNGNAGDSFGNPAFGTISAVDPNYLPRQFQFALKALF